MAAEPQLVNARQFLCNSYLGRAQDFMDLNHFADALPDWERALELHDGASRTAIRLRRTICLARLGRAADAAREAGDLAVASKATAATIYTCSGIFAVAAGTADNPAADAHAARAVELLRQVFMRGYRNVAQMQKDADFASLHHRADYADLLWDFADASLPNAKPAR